MEIFADIIAYIFVSSTCEFAHERHHAILQIDFKR